MEFSREEYWSGLPFPSPGVFATQGSKPCLLHWHTDSLPMSHIGSPDTEVLAGKRGCFPMFRDRCGNRMITEFHDYLDVCLFIHSFTWSSVIQQMLFEHRLFAGYRPGLLHVYAVVVDTCSSIELLLGQQTLVGQKHSGPTNGFLLSACAFNMENGHGHPPYQTGSML